MLDKYSKIIAENLNLQENQVRNTLTLLLDGATIPFISRYRKEMTQSLDEVKIEEIHNKYNKLFEIDKRRNVILSSIDDQGKLTPELKEQILAANSMQTLEDMYLPYRPKKKTRASIAIEKGLEPFAKTIYEQRDTDVYRTAEKFINNEKGVSSVDEALQGARDIIAEWICENVHIRENIRNIFIKWSVIFSKLVKNKQTEGNKYELFFDFSEPLSKAPSHRILAMFRGEKEGFLRLSIAPDNEEKTIDTICNRVVKYNNQAANQVKIAVKDSYKRLLQPQMETEMRSYYKEKADKEAIAVFVANLRQLLLYPPLGQKRILALDPGFRTGCKVVILNEQGQLLHNETIYPHPPQAEYKLASDKLKRLVLQYNIDVIAIGNGTAGRETENFVKRIPFEKDVKAIVVNESGASVYSASATARAEFSDYDVTVRGAVSIGRRLMDPLAELVKIDPKSLGVGQYQHDVNQSQLTDSLNATVISCVNKVGVEINTASKELLSYVSGVGPQLAEKIIEYRNKNGPFKSRKEFNKVPRFGNKAFEQASGFLRIRNAVNQLDNSAVHPESYSIVDSICKKNNCSVEELINNESIRKSINLNDFISEKTGLPTLKDIMSELGKSGRDPRSKLDFFEFDKNVHSINDLYPQMVLPGIITNITNFGCFVDIGVHQDGLVHISNITNRFINDPNEIVKLNDKVLVKILDVDIARKRISLSIKDAN